MSWGEAFVLELFGEEVVLLDVDDRHTLCWVEIVEADVLEVDLLALH